MTDRVDLRPSPPLGVSGRKFLLSVLAIAALVCGVVAWRTRSGIEVTVTNDEAFPLRDVDVWTSAGAYALLDLAPGDAASTTVGVLGESSVWFEWTSSDGSRHRGTADVYIEGTPEGTSMYGGWVKFVVAGGVAREEHHIFTTLNPISRRTPPEARR